MGWFDEQIRQRIQYDDDAFSDAFAGMASAVMGKKLARAFMDQRVQTKNAIEEILKFYHVKIEEVPDSITDLNEQLEYLMRPAGIMRRSVSLEEGWYKNAVGAMLGVRKEDGRVVALLPAGISGYVYYLNGRRIRLNEQTAAELEDEALCFYEPFPQRKIGIGDLGLYILRCLAPSDFALAGFITLAVTLVGMILPFISRLIYGSVIGSGSLRLLLAVFAFMLSVKFAQVLMNTSKRLIMERINGKINAAVNAAGMARLFSLPASFFKDYSSGSLAGRMNCIGMLSRTLVDCVLSSGLTAVFSLAYISQMLSYGPGLALPGMAVILISLAVSAIVVLVQMRVTRKTLEASSKEQGISYAMISGVQKIKLAGAEKRAFAKWASAYVPLAKLSYDPPFFVKFGSVISACIPLVGTVVIYYFAIRSRVELADYFAFQSAYGMVTGAFAMLTGMIASIAQIKPVYEMIRPIFEAEPEIEKNRKVVERLGGGIELNNVSFRYTDDMPPVLDNLSLKIRPGQYVAIVGRTGCGKSTLLRLLLGFEKPQRGAVYYDGRDLSKLDLRSLRRKIGVVMQDGKLFQGDIYSNITVTAPQLTMQEAWQALEMAGIADDVRNMPMGIHTLISEGSGGISGGQRQRLMIARAIAAKPKILMFDEATSALDNIAQKTVSDSLANLKCTRIVIAHRLSTIKECDRILVLNKGRIIEDGSYDQLIAQNGYFADLVARQRI